MTRSVRGVAATAVLAARLAGAAIAGAIVACGDGSTAPASAPQFTAGISPPWYGGPGNQPASYEFGTSTSVFHGGARSAAIRSVGTVPDGGFGPIGQAIWAKDYRGKRVRLTGWVRTQAVQGGASLWLRVDGSGGGLLLDNMDGRRVSGTSDWRQLQIVLDVPAAADGLVFGGLTVGGGQAWFDDFALDIVGPDVPTTTTYPLTPSGDATRAEQMRAFYATAPRAVRSRVRGPVAA
jgi:hypothetical protein